MSAFPKTRAAAEYAARHTRAELTCTHAAVLVRRITACQASAPARRVATSCVHTEHWRGKAPAPHPVRYPLVSKVHPGLGAWTRR